MDAKRTLVCCWWLCIVSIVVLLKYYYSVATAMELQWLLKPLAWMTQLFSSLQFHINPDGEWLNDEHNIAIVKQCAGLNFMIMSVFVYAQRIQPAVAGRFRPARLVLSAGCCTALCLAGAWAATLMVNTARILIAILLYRHDVIFAGLSQDQLHRMSGVLIYFPALWLQTRMVIGIRTGLAGLLAVTLFLGIVIVLPLVDGNFRLHPRLFSEHAFFTIGTVLLMLVLYPACRGIRKLFAGQFSRFHDRCCGRFREYSFLK